LSLERGFESGTAHLTERPDGLHVRGPRFVVQASLRCDLGGEGEWSVGFVQAVRALDVRILYGPAGQASWELPFSPVSDSDGHFPWYSRESHAPACEGTQTVRLADAVDNHVSWTPPAGSGASTAAANLAGITRRQSFRVWLIAHHHASGSSFVIDAFDWSVAFDVVVRAERPVGRRAEVVKTETSAVVEAPSPLPPRVLVPPTANALQQMWWTSPSGARTRLRAHAWAPVSP